MHFVSVGILALLLVFPSSSFLPLASRRHSVNILNNPVVVPAKRSDSTRNKNAFVLSFGSSLDTEDAEQQQQQQQQLSLDTQMSRSRFMALTASSYMLLAASSPKTASAESSNREDLALGATTSTSTLTIGEGGKKKDSQTFQEAVSGFVAGSAVSAAKTLVKYPLDTATVRLQMPGTDYSIFNLVRLFDGSYRGVSAPLISNIPGGAVFFSVKDAVKSSLKESGLPRWLSTSLAVAAGQVPYWLVRNPSEVVKTRQQAKIDGYGENVSTFDAFSLVRDEARRQSNSTSNGVEGLYIGYWENILYAYPADVIKFICYERITKGRKGLSPQEGALAGAASTAIAQLVTTPLDVVRNRIMAGTTKKVSGTDNAPVSYLESLSTLAKEEGVKGLFAGASPRVGKAILSGAIQFATYEETKKDIAKLFQNR